MGQNVPNNIIFTVAVLFLSFSSASSSYSQYNTLVVNTLPSSSPIFTSPELESLTSTVSDSTTSLTVHLSHVDALSSFSDASPSDLFNLRLKRDSLRVKSLTNLAALSSRKNVTNKTPPSPGAGFSGEVTPGRSLGSGEYFMRLGVGTPASNVDMIVDTGSDVIWQQCSPCKSCYKQSDPVFDPTNSKTFAAVPCGSPLCRKLGESSSECVTRGSKTCLYQVSYGDGSFTKGDFSTETLTFSGARFDHVALGCGRDNQGLFVGAAGVLGLGRGGVSFPSQTKNRYNGQFSYCLVDRTSEGSASKKPSTIVFGNGAVPERSVFTPLLTNPKIDTFYYLQLLGISVGRSRVSGVTESQFKLKPNGDGGVIIDSGVSVTRLIKPAYVAFRDAFLLKAAGLKRAPSHSLLDTCFDLSGTAKVEVPIVVFHFAGGDVSLPASNCLIPLNEQGQFCFAFAGATGSLSIIGNIQQQGFRVAYDLVGSRVGFMSGAC